MKSTHSSRKMWDSFFVKRYVGQCRTFGYIRHILFYSILFYSILFYSILFYSILFYSILFYSKHHCASRVLTPLIHFLGSTAREKSPVFRALLPPAQAKALCDAKVWNRVCSLCPPFSPLMEFSACHYASQGQVNKTCSSADLHTCSYKDKLYFPDGYTP